MGNSIYSRSAFVEGWRIVHVDPKGPCSKQNIMNYFDFIVGISAGDRVLDINSHGIGNQIQKQAENGNEIKLKIQNYKTMQIKEVVIVPICNKSDSDKAGSLGLTVQYNMNSTRCNKCIRIKGLDKTKLGKITDLSPVVQARLDKGLSGDGFEISYDFILGLSEQPTVTFETKKEFEETVLGHFKESNSISFNVYNDKEKKVRTMTVDQKDKVLVADCLFDLWQIPSFPAGMASKNTLDLKVYYADDEAAVSVNKTDTMRVALKTIYDKMKLREEAVKKIYCVQLTNKKRSLSVSLHPSSDADMSKLVKDFDMYKVTEMDLETDDFKINCQFGDKKQDVGIKQSYTVKIALDTIFEAMKLKQTEIEGIGCMTLKNDKFEMKVPLNFDDEEQMSKVVEEYEMYHFSELSLKHSGNIFKISFEGKKQFVTTKPEETMSVVFKAICDKLELTQAQIENIDCIHLKNANGTANMTLWPSDEGDMKKCVKDFETYKFDEIILEMKRVELNVHFDGKAQKVMVNKTKTIKDALQAIYKQLNMEEANIPKINSLRLQNAEKSMNFKLITADEDNMSKLVQQFDVFHITDLYLEIIHIIKIDDKEQE